MHPYIINVEYRQCFNQLFCLYFFQTRLTQATNQTEATKQAALSKYKEACRSTNTRPNEALSEEYEQV